MTRKDYVAIANAIKNRKIEAGLIGTCVEVVPLDDFIEIFSEIAKTDNPIFDKAKFKAAIRG